MSEESQFSEDTNIGWIQWFCSIEDHQFFCEVNENYIRSQINLYGLKSKVEKYNQALKMILRAVPPAEEEVEDPKFVDLYAHATQLYGLIHARYITTPQGLAVMRERYLAGRFGTCPRIMCEKQNTLPIAINQDLKIARVKIYCPRCKDIYCTKKKSSDCDGAYFGTGFPYLLLMTYPDLKPFFKRQEFTPKIFGFKIDSHPPGPIHPQQQKTKLECKEQPNQQLSQSLLKVQSTIKAETVPKKKNKNKK